MYQELDNGITLIDTGYIRPQLAAAYLIAENNHAAIVETGTSLCVPRFLEALEMNGIAEENVDYIIVTHVHLDHAGGAGALMAHCPNAKLLVHPRGARHMINPEKLVAGVKAVYGDAETARLYGELPCIPEERVIALEDNAQVELQGRILTFLDTPGHARHHFCVFDELSRGFFTGDTFGLSYRAFDTHKGAFIFPTTTPVQFEPQAMHASIERLLSYNPQIMYLTHFGTVTEIGRLAQDLHRQIDAFVEVAESTKGMGGDERQAILEAGVEKVLLEGLRAHDCQLPEARCHELLAMDIKLNAQGLAFWCDHGRD